MWRADAKAPYNPPTYTKAPAPNAYFNSKKADDVKKRLLAEEKPIIPFGSKDMRSFHKQTKNVNPGPGNYIDIYAAQNSSVGTKLHKIQED